MKNPPTIKNKCYPFSFAGKNCSISTVTIPLNELSLYGFKNSCLKSLFFLSTPLLVLTVLQLNHVEMHESKAKII